MYCIAKNIWKYLVKSETLLYFVVPNVHYSCDRVHISDFRNKAGLSLWYYSSVGSGRLATITGEARLFFIQTFRLCQTSLKVASRYKVSTLQTKCATSASQDRYSSEPNSRMKSRLTKSESPEYGMMPKNSISRICTTSIIPSWLWAEPLWSFTSAIPRVR